MNSVKTLCAQGLFAGYGPRRHMCDVLHDVSLVAQSGQFIALVGPNGSGKSTLLKVLAGLIPLRLGTVALDDSDFQTLGLKMRARQIAFLAQAREATPSLSVTDIVRLGRAPYRGALGQISTEGEAHITRALEITDTQRLHARQIGSLSGGEQARVLLARALVVDAPILLTDEPIAALDPYYQLSMMAILQAEAARGKIVIAALHDLALAQQFCDHIWVMDKGRLVGNAPSDTALSETLLRTVFRISAPPTGFHALQIS